MPHLFKKNKIELLLLLALIISSTIIRIIWLDRIPPNISGDEVTNLSDIYKIMFSNKSHLLEFMGDGSVIGVNFYPMVLLIRLLGIDNSITAMRLSIAMVSILSLIPFYFLVKWQTSRITAIVFSCLLSANFVFLNFSRTAWINMYMVLTGLTMILFIEKLKKENSKIWPILGGLFAGATLYGYHYGRILVAGAIFYLIIYVAKNRNIINLTKLTIFTLVLVASLLPLIFKLSLDNNNREALLRRPRATYAFSQEKQQEKNIKQILFDQSTNTIQGFILLSPDVMDRGFENIRYVPQNSSIVNPIIRISFIISIISIFLLRIPFIWLVVFSTIIVAQLYSDFPPNFSRGLLYIPFVYFICALFFHKVLNIVSNRKIKTYLTIIMINIAIGIYLLDVSKYFSWMEEKYLYDARQPAIDYSEFDKWQKYQISRVKFGMNPVTNYEWYEIRKGIK